MATTPPPDAQAATAPAAPCLTSLQALARGTLADFKGLAGCTRAMVKTALGDGGAERSGPFGAFRAYPVAAGAPAGMLVFFAGDTVTMVEVDGPTLATSVESALGAPEATERSRLEPMSTQLIYASRGLIAHVDNQTREASHLFAIAPTTVQAFLASPLSRLEIRDEPLE